LGQVWDILKKGLYKMEKENKLNQKDWLEYLNNLNNREISKLNSSGFNTWALFGLIGFVLFKLFDILPIVFMDIKKVFLTKLAITNIFNFCIIITVFMFVLSIPRDEKRKFYTKFMKNALIFVGGVLYFIHIVGFFSNIYITVYLKYYGLSVLPYCIFAIYETIFIIGLLINKITTKKENKMPRIESGYIYNKKLRNIAKYIYLFFCLVLSISFIFSIYQIIKNYNILNYLIVLKLAVYLSAFIGAIILLIANITVLIRNRWLEEFERKIMLQNLDEKEIVKEFIDKFVGKDITQWLKEIEDETKKLNTRIMGLYNEFEKKFNNLNQKEKDLNKRIMIQKNLSKLTKVTMNYFIKYREKYENNAKKINHFLKQGPLSNEENLLIKEYIRHLEKEHKTQLDIITRVTTLGKEVEKYVDATNKLKKRRANRL